METTIPVLLCVDVEPDEREVDPDSQADWVGFECAVELINVLRPQLEAVTGRRAHASWFLRMDPQITHVYGRPGWVADRYRRVFDALVANGDELGLHLHPWQWDRERSAWFQNFADQSWVSHCVVSAFAAFEQAFGHSCRASRFGDRWMNDETMSLLRSLGVTCETTVEPGQTGTETPDVYTGTFPDYSDVPRHPYWPSRQDFRSPSPEPTRDMLVVPVSSAPAAWASTPSLGDCSGTRRNLVVVSDADYEGSHDAASLVEVAGWVWDRNNPGRVLDVEILCDGDLLATVGATRHRPDLADAAKGDGQHAFRLATPSCLKDGRPHVGSVRVAGTDLNLHGTPRTLEGTADRDSDYVTLALDHHPFTFGLLVDRLLARPSTEHLILKVRSDFGRDPQRISNFRVNMEQLLTHPLAPCLNFTTPSDFHHVFRRMA